MKRSLLILSLVTIMLMTVHSYADGILSLVSPLRMTAYYDLAQKTCIAASFFCDLTRDQNHNHSYFSYMNKLLAFELVGVFVLLKGTQSLPEDPVFQRIAACILPSITHNQSDFSLFSHELMLVNDTRYQLETDQFMVNEEVSDKFIEIRNVSLLVLLACDDPREALKNSIDKFLELSVGTPKFSSIFLQKEECSAHEKIVVEDETIIESVSHVKIMSDTPYNMHIDIQGHVVSSEIAERSQQILDYPQGEYCFDLMTQFVRFTRSLILLLSNDALDFLIKLVQLFF